MEKKIIDDGGLAFPGNRHEELIMKSPAGEQRQWGPVEYSGMTLRDYFAAHATASDVEDYILRSDSVAQAKYRYADDMIAQREKPL